MRLLLDIGGSYTKLALSSDGVELNISNRIPTRRDFTDGMNAIEDEAKRITLGSTIQMIVAGIAGPLNHPRTEMIGRGGLPNWYGHPIKDVIEQRLQAPVFLENDAALAGLGEATFGAAVGSRIVGYLTFSTGVGGARIVDGNFDATVYGSEPGFTIVAANPNNGPDFKRIEYLGAYISGAAIENKTGNKAENIKDQVFWEDISRWMAVAINNAIMFWSPNIMVIGGGISQSVDLESLKRLVSKANRSSPQTTPPILKAMFGDNSGLYGALRYSTLVDS